MKGFMIKQCRWGKAAIDEGFAFISRLILFYSIRFLINFQQPGRREGKTELEIKEINL